MDDFLAEVQAKGLKIAALAGGSDETYFSQATPNSIQLGLFESGKVVLTESIAEGLSLMFQDPNVIWFSGVENTMGEIASNYKKRECDYISNSKGFLRISTT